MSNVLVFVLELIGTAAFAVSGAIVGIKKQMDLFGVIVLGVCTAVGGGIVRDVILGVTPPATFHDPVYTLTAAAVSVLMFLPHVRARVARPPCSPRGSRSPCSCRTCAPASGGTSRCSTGCCW